ncbi:glycosyltransferase family 4 protein [bacterium]|nr:glycosyltransferase family 4 protein [bacterium]
MKRKLKIGMTITGNYTIPPPKGIIYAPMVIAQAIAEGLTKKGHEVYFFAPEGSKLKIKKIITGKIKPIHGIRGKKELKILKGKYVGPVERAKIFALWDQYFISLMYKFAIEKKLDILHIHPIDRALPFGMAFEKIPVVYTLHDPVYPWRAKVFKMFSSKNQYLVSISKAQRKPALNLNWIATIYNGINLKLFPFSKKPKNFLLFLGRLLPQKGPDIALQAAIKTKEKLLIAGLPAGGKFWEEKIKPYLGKQIQYIGNIPYEKTYKYYGQAKALLCPIQWEEPFGLTFVEAMACGTPVIAFDRGSASEVIKNGKTGFVVKPFDKRGKTNIKEFLEAIKKIDTIKREECRKWVEEKFSFERMISDYEKVFLKIANKK